MLTTILRETMIYTPLILGIYLSFRILKITDLTADGSFVLGSGIYTRLVACDMPYPLCILMGMVGGGLVGFVLSVIQRKNKVPPIVASVLCVFMLQSVNILVMGAPNISLLPFTNFFIRIHETHSHAGMFILGMYVLTALGLFIYMIKSRLGLKMRAFGANYHLLAQENLHPERLRCLGLVLSNVLYALSGIMVTHIQNFTDLHMGRGVALMGIGAVIIGLQLFHLMGRIQLNAYSGIKEIFACLCGAFAYFTLLDILIALDVNPNLVKLLLGLVLTLVFSLKIKTLTS